MNMHSILSATADWLIETTWQVAVMAALVLIAQTLLRPWLSPRARYAMWMLVALRLAIPLLPASPWSIYNLAHASAPTSPPRAIFSVGGEVVSPPITSARPLNHVAVTAVPAHISSIDWRVAVIGTWLTIAILLAIRMAIQSRRMRGIIARGRDVGLDELVRECQQSIGMRRVIRVLEATSITPKAKLSIARSWTRSNPESAYQSEPTSRMTAET